MIEVLSKPAEQITAGDIQSLIESEVPEGEQIEFKETLPAKKGTVDPWMRGEGKIGDRAKSELLEEVVAFANAYGGAFVLGVRESDAKPPVAAEITPVPRCAELAERLKLVFRDCVDPQIPRIEIFAVRTKDDSGVVIFRVGQSRQAPHRVTTTRVCPVRRADRCEGMSMREIQDMTLKVSRGLEALERRLSERSERFSREFGVLKTPDEAVGFRLTAASVGGEIGFDRVFRQGRIAEELNEPWHRIMRGAGENPRPLEAPRNLPAYWRPILRGARAERHYYPYQIDQFSNSYREVHCDGLIELGFVTGSNEYQGRTDLYCSQNYLFESFANLISHAHRIRNQAGAPAAEYAIEVEICIIGRTARLMLPAYASSPETPEELRQGSTTFPRYSLGDRDEISDLLNLFYRDFWNHMGADIDAETDTLVIEGWPNED